MTDGSRGPEAPEASSSPERRHRGSSGVKVLVAGVAVLVVGAGALIARSMYWSLRPAPDFPSLAEIPDPGLTGTVAFLEPNAGRCVYLVAASGGEPKELACLDGTPRNLTWRADGKLQATGHKGRDGTGEAASWIIDPITGHVATVPTDEIPPRSKAQQTNVGPNGETVTCTSRRGTLTLTRRSGHREGRLLSVGAPSTYCMGDPAWNGDGSWFVVKDDLDRLLLITNTQFHPGITRILVEGGTSQAVTDAQLIER